MPHDNPSPRQVNGEHLMSRPAFERIVRVVACSLAWSAALALPRAGSAQGTRADYERADALRGRTAGRVFQTRVEPHWFGGNDRFWYRNDLAAGAREFLVIDAVAASRRPAFDHAALAEALARVLGRP